MTDMRRADRVRVYSRLEVLLLRDLPDDFIGVLEPTVQGVDLDALVVGPQGLFVLHPLDWVGEITPTRHSHWLQRSADGKVLRHSSPAQAAQRADQALHRFLKDEFPTHKLTIHHYAVLLDPAAILAPHSSSTPPCVTLDALVRELLAIPTPATGALDTPEKREELATALEERLLTRSQRAAEPFIFRSGGSLGRGKKVRTIAQAARHMDNYPDDGVYHLRNGTLEQWFSSQGALHLSRIARQAQEDNLRDARAALETLLINSGMVKRPKLVSVPRRLDLGYVLEGQMARGLLELRKGRGRGYLFGRAEASEPWIQVVPAEFEGELKAGVTIDTSALAIKNEPWHGAVRVYSSASAEPTETPVAVRVVPAVSTITRVLVRPLIALLIGAVLGIAIGYWLGPGSMDPPFGLRTITTPALSLRQVWMLVCGGIWALFGLFRGLSWDPVLPTGKCVLGWLLRVLVWGLTLSAVAFLSPYLARWLYPTYTDSVPAQVEQTIKLVAVTLAVIPATWGGIISDRYAHTIGRRGRAFRGLARGIVAATAVAAVLILLRVGRPLWQRYEGAERVQQTRVWIVQRWDELGGWVDDLWGDAYLRQNDRRAPTRARPTASPQAGADEESGVQ